MTENIRLLHVDDEPNFSAVAARFLERQDPRFTVETAASAEEGLRLLGEQDIDCIVSDYDMPGRDGIEFLEDVREEYPGLPFVLFTGKGSEAVASEAVSAGVTDYLQKQSGAEQYELLANRILNAVEKQRAQRNYRELFEKSAVGVTIVDPETKTIIDANSRFAQILGRDVEEVVGVHPAALSPDEPSFDRARGDRLLAQTIEEGPRTFEWLHQRSDGQNVWAEVTLNPTTITGQQRILGIVREITGRKERERELRETERRYQAIFNDPNILVALLDVDGTVLDVNQTAMEYVEAPREDVLGELFWETEWWNDDTRSHIRQHVERAAGGEYVEYEANLTKPDGEPYSVTGVIRPVIEREDGEERVVSLFVSAKDVTERKERERQLRNEREFVERALDSLSDLFYVVKRDGTLCRWNDQVAAVTGYTDEEIAEMDAVDFFPADQRDRVAAAIEEVFATGRASVEAELVTADGMRIPHEFTGALLTDSEPDEAGFAGAGRDIRERVRQERRLRRERDQLDEFASVVSHDLRNPLSVAEGRLELAREECETEHLDVAGETLDRMEGIIDDVLWLAREGRAIEDLEPVTVEDVVENAWLIVADDIEDAKLEYAGDTDRRVEADRDRFQRLLENLFRNAVEHGSTNNRTGSDDAVEHGGPDVTVRVEVTPTGIAVEDDGPGIPPEERHRVFDAGYSTADDGTGFGLRIVEKIAEAHRWDIHVTEGVEGGARFEITDVTFVE